MSQRWYGMCHRYHGKVVRITERGGRIHVGRISRVTPTHVYLQPHPGRIGGYGYGYGGWGFGYGVALGAVTGIALAGLLWW